VVDNEIGEDGADDRLSESGEFQERRRQPRKALFASLVINTSLRDQI
jgi:hypothetical protein